MLTSAEWLKLFVSARKCVLRGFAIYTYVGDQIREVRMGGRCCTNGTVEICVHNFSTKT